MTQQLEQRTLKKSLKSVLSSFLTSLKAATDFHKSVVTSVWLYRNGCLAAVPVGNKFNKELHRLVAYEEPS